MQAWRPPLALEARVMIMIKGTSTMVQTIGLTSCRDVETNGEIFRSRVLPLPIANPPGGGGGVRSDNWS